jgi:hypothetical protein
MMTVAENEEAINDLKEKVSNLEGWREGYRGQLAMARFTDKKIIAWEAKQKGIRWTLGIVVTITVLLSAAAIITTYNNLEDSMNTTIQSLVATRVVLEVDEQSPILTDLVVQAGEAITQANAEASRSESFAGISEDHSTLAENAAGKSEDYYQLAVGLVEPIRATATARAEIFKRSDFYVIATSTSTNLEAALRYQENHNQLGYETTIYQLLDRNFITGYKRYETVALLEVDLQQTRDALQVSAYTVTMLESCPYKQDIEGIYILCTQFPTE